MRRFRSLKSGAFAGTLACALWLACPVAHATDTAGGTKRSALVVFFAPTPTGDSSSEDDAIEAELSSIPTLSTGILSATQGAYTSAQFALDITQGARVSNSAYDTSEPPALGLGIPGLKSVAHPPRGLAHDRHRLPAGRTSSSAGSVSQVQPWPAVLTRARSAPQQLIPGLLAAQIPGGAGYVPADGVESVNGVIAADRRGHVASVLAQPDTPRSVAELQAHHRLVVVDLSGGVPGYAELRRLAASRPAGELLIVVQRVADEPNNTTAGQSGNELLWIALAGAGAGGHTLTSQTTNQNGLIAAVDIAPTILAHLGLPIPAEMRGRPIHTDGPLNGARLRALKSRLGVISSRRLPALTWLIAAWALLLAAVRLPFGAGRHDARAARASAAERHDARAARASGAERHDAQSSSPHRAGEWPTRVAWAIRVGALAMLWTPVTMLVPAALEPSRTAEFALLVAVSFALGALTDRLVPWPRAPIAPAIATVVALSLDALAGAQLLVRSLLGPNPEFGARFYGIGNELKSALAVLLFTAIAAALYPAVRSRRAATVMACGGILLAAVEGSARIGAGVGGVILVSAGTAVATVMLLPGSLNRKRALIAMAAPVLGLLALAALDLATAHGGGHFTGSVLDARSAGDIRDIVVRRYGAAYDELRNHLMPVATAVALLASVLPVRRRERVLAPVDSDPAWLAALAGGLAAGVIGALTEDSGPVLLVVAVFVLACVLSYLWGRPAHARALNPSSPSTSPATRSRARRRSAAPFG